MPYELPTVAMFRARFPEFVSIADERIQFFISEAQLYVDETWIESNYQPGILMFAAHNLYVEGKQGTNINEADNTGSRLKRRKVGDVEVEFEHMDLSGGKGGLTGEASASPYGRRYLKLLQLNQPGMFVV